MFLKGIFSTQPAGKQLLLLLLLMVLGSIFAYAAGVTVCGLFYGFDFLSVQNPGAMRLFQFISATSMFLLPAWMTAYLISPNTRKFLYTGHLPSLPVFGWVLVSMFLLSPAINLASLLNQQLTLPAGLAPLETWMKAQEETARIMTERLIGEGDFPTLAGNLFVIALTAAVTEEFLFRGTLSRLLGRFGMNHHAVIWTAAALFSAFHLQFYGFIPRMLLGAYFGYLLYWSKSIWIPVFAHFVNNATAVVGMSVENLKDNEFITGEISDAHWGSYLATALVFLSLFWLVCKKIKEAEKNNRHSAGYI